MDLMEVKKTALVVTRRNSVFSGSFCLFVYLFVCGTGQLSVTKQACQSRDGLLCKFFERFCMEFTALLPEHLTGDSLY